MCSRGIETPGSSHFWIYWKTNREMRMIFLHLNEVLMSSGTTEKCSKPSEGFFSCFQRKKSPSEEWLPPPGLCSAALSTQLFILCSGYISSIVSRNLVHSADPQWSCSVGWRMGSSSTYLVSFTTWQVNLVWESSLEPGSRRHRPWSLGQILEARGQVGSLEDKMFSAWDSLWRWTWWGMELFVKIATHWVGAPGFCGQHGSLVAWPGSFLSSQCLHAVMRSSVPSMLQIYITRKVSGLRADCPKDLENNFSCLCQLLLCPWVSQIHVSFSLSGWGWSLRPKYFELIRQNTVVSFSYILSWIHEKYP